MPKKSPAHSSAHTHGTPGYYGKSYTPEPDQVGTYHGAQYTWELPKQTNDIKKTPYIVDSDNNKVKYSVLKEEFKQENTHGYINEDGDNFIEDYTFKGLYFIKYLQYITKLFSIYSNIHLYLDEANPLMITFEKSNEDKSNITIQYFIAPNCSDE